MVKPTNEEIITSLEGRDDCNSELSGGMAKCRILSKINNLAPND
jgi:hypothetical protein